MTKRRKLAVAVLCLAVSAASAGCGSAARTKTDTVTRTGITSSSAAATDDPYLVWYCKQPTYDDSGQPVVGDLQSCIQDTKQQAADMNRTPDEVAQSYAEYRGIAP